MFIFLNSSLYVNFLVFIQFTFYTVHFFMAQFLHGSIFIIQNLYFQKTLQHFSFKNFLDLIIFYTLLLALLTLRFFTI